jgi:hypothetical protein
MCKRGGTHELVRAKDGFAEGGELDGRDGDFPDAVVLHAGPAEGPCDDLVAKADAEELQGRCVGDDARDVCDQRVDPRDVLVGGCACETGSGGDDKGTETNESR